MIVSIQKRVQKYIIHLALSVIAPLLLTMILIIITGSREFGIVYGIFSALIMLNIFYGFYFLKSKLWINLNAGLVVTAVSCGVVYIVLTYKIKPDFDFYGIYTALFFYSIASIFAWEICYQMTKNSGAANGPSKTDVSSS